MDNNKDAKIINKNILEQYRDDIKLYALYVNRIRMIPSVKDGLKFIHRRIIYGAFEYEKAITKTVKSSTIVGTVMKTMHPHGDASIYDAMKPLTNWYEINEPLLIGQGNWGSYQGNPAAAARYTESRISPFCIETTIGDLTENKQVVDWNETYDGSKLEPESLPVKLPLLLINGAFGIGYGLKVEIPPHNITEVIDATINLIRDPNYKVILIPEQCMQCDIIESDFESISGIGNGSFTVRGRIDIGEYNGRPALFIKSCPDLVFLNTITNKINDMIKEKKLLQIYEIKDNSKKENMEYIISLKKGTDPNYVREIIYKNTPMQKGFKVNFEVLDKSNPLRMNYKTYLQSFIEYRKITKFRLYCNKYQYVNTKYHERQAYIKVLQSGEIENIINMIRNQRDVNDNYLIEYLVKTLNITDLQAKFIINSNIKSLSIGYLDKYIKESDEYLKLSEEYQNKIINEDIIIQEILDELNEYKQKYGKPRRCKVISKASISDIPEGDFKIIITNKNYIKKVPLNTSIGSFKEDNPKFVIKVENTQNILLFSEQGRVYKLPIHKIPLSPKNSNGIDIRTLIKKLTSNICAIMYEPTLKKLSKNKIKYFITVLTCNSNIKKLDIEDFLSVPPSGLIYIKLDKDDIVSTVSTIGNGLDIIIYSKNKALRMNIEEVPHQKRNNKGMKSIAENEADGLSIIYPSTTDIITITESGYINRSDVTSLPRLGRNKIGSKVIKLHKGDSIKCIFGLNQNNIVKVITKNESYEIPVLNIELCSSISTGKKMIPMKNDNIIHCIIKNIK